MLVAPGFALLACSTFQDTARVCHLLSCDSDSHLTRMDG